jgi:hypothetical protein
LVPSRTAGSFALPYSCLSAQAQERQDKQDYHNQTDQINQPAHVHAPHFLPLREQQQTRSNVPFGRAGVSPKLTHDEKTSKGKLSAAFTEVQWLGFRCVPTTGQELAVRASGSPSHIHRV